jgi:hypothetical protein
MRQSITDSRSIDDNLATATKIANRRSPANRRNRAAQILENRVKPPQATTKPFVPNGIDTPKKYREYMTRSCDIPNAMGLKDLAYAIGNAYHKNVKALAKSSDGYVVYGKGGQEETSMDSYSKGWHAKYGPKRWKNAGVRLDGLVARVSHNTFTHTIPPQGVKKLALILESHLGNLVATIHLGKLPKGWQKLKQAALLDNEILGIDNGTHIARYDTAFHKTGVAIAMPEDLKNRFGKWEHGTTIAQCRSEIAQKRQVINNELRKVAETHKQARRLHLVTVMCHNLRVIYQHARTAGLCDAGIRQYCASHSLSVDSGAPAGVLRRTNDSRAYRAIEVAARELLASRA